MSLLSCLIVSFVSDRHDVLHKQIHTFRAILLKFMLVMSIRYVGFLKSLNLVPTLEVTKFIQQLLNGMMDRRVGIAIEIACPV
jgi:hypothetical protein